jgi:hypothetical protein
VNRFSWILAAFCLLTIGVSQQGSDPGLGKVKNETAPVGPIVTRTNVQIPTPKELEVVVIFANGDFAVLTQGQFFSIPKGEPFRTIWGKNAEYTYRNLGEKSGNLNYEVIRR